MRKYFEMLEAVAVKYKTQNANNPQEAITIRKLNAFSKLMGEVDVDKTLAGAIVVTKQTPSSTIQSKLYEKLYAHYGFKSFRPNQLQIMTALG